MDKWTICNKTADFSAIINEFGFSEVMARLLVNRDLRTGGEIRAFLTPSLSDLHSPHLLKNLDEAVDLVIEKIRAGKKIRIVGDYDVDGIMATYVLNDALTRTGADADWYIPHRIKDGYGLNSEIIRQAGRDGVDTIITCDNGIAALDASIEAEKLGMTLVVTDHHEIPAVLPHAAFIVDPKQEDDHYPCREICGAVLAAKFAGVLFEKLGTDADISEYLEFMAMATICDVVPLKGENRTIAKLGLAKLEKTDNPGLRSLMEQTEISDGHINEYHVGFIMGPCFNATGRIDNAGLALELLNARNKQDADRLALECKKLNEDRKQMTSEQEEIAFSILDARADALDRVIVLELPDCHESILGILAGRVKERYNRPSIIVTKSGNDYKGSARSIPAYNIFEELSVCSEYLVKFGGHPMAAGLTVASGKLEEFTRAINERCRLSEEDMSRKVLIDAQASFNLFNEKVLSEIEMLAPFGQGNPAPLFAEKGLRCRSIKYIGKTNNYLRFRLINSCGYEFTATSFSDASETVERLTAKYGKADVEKAFTGGSNNISMTVAFVPKINDYHGASEIQMNIRNIKW